MLCWMVGAALAQSNVSEIDFSGEASRRMNLSVDFEEVDAMLAQPAALEAWQQQMQAQPQPPLPLEPNSRAEEVVVFRDRALVSRVREAAIPSGVSSVTFEGLPLGLQAASLHAAVTEGDAQIIGVELVSGAGEVAEDARTAELRAQAQAVTEELGQVRDRIEALLAQRAYLRTALLAAPEQGRPQPPLRELSGMLDYVGEAEKRIAADLRQQEARAQELDEALAPLLVKLANPLATGQTVKVTVEAPRAGKLGILLRYQVGGASWSPSYNARYDPATGQVEIEYFALVAQSTAEVWADARLRLSTGDPAVGGEVPQLQSWYLGRDGSGAVYATLEEGRGLYDTPEEGDGRWSPPAGGAVASTFAADIEGAGPVVFATPGRRTIAGDGSQHRIPVGAQTFPAATELISTPRQVAEVFRRAKIRYAGDIPLLAGPIATYVGGDYVGSGSVQTAVPGEELLLSFGTDEQLKVTRQLISRNKEHIGRKTVRYTFHFRIRVQNFGRDARIVQVLDQVPVSEIDKVEVRVLQDSAPQAPDAEDGPGILRWKLDVPAGGERTIDLAFSVTAPEDVYLPTVAF